MNNLEVRRPFTTFMAIKTYSARKAKLTNRRDSLNFKIICIYMYIYICICHSTGRSDIRDIFHEL